MSKIQAGVFSSGVKSVSGIYNITSIVPNSVTVAAANDEQVIYLYIQVYVGNKFNDKILVDGLMMLDLLSLNCAKFLQFRLVKVNNICIKLADDTVVLLHYAAIVEINFMGIVTTLTAYLLLVIATINFLLSR